METALWFRLGKVVVLIKLKLHNRSVSYMKFTTLASTPCQINVNVIFRSNGERQRDGWKCGCRESEDENVESGGEFKKETRRREKGVRKGGKVGGDTVTLWCLSIEVWTPATKTRLAPYTSSLHVKGRLHCPALTAHLTCLDWKKGEISLAASPLTPSRLNKPISWTFLLQRRLLYTRAK